MFDTVFKNHVTPQLARYFGGQVCYVHPLDAADQEPFKLQFVMVSDIRREKRNRQHGHDIVETRYFQMIINKTVDNFCGIEKIAVGGRLVLELPGGDCEEWPIKEKPATSSDGFANVMCERHLRHEIGNSQVRGLN